MSAAFRLIPFVLPIALVASLLVIFVPLPAVVLDVLLVGNVALAVLVLLTTVSVQSPLEFSIFPSLLLATTLSRLVLNIATTRLILTHADLQGSRAAGGVIEGFGRFVAGDELVVGLVIFLILVIVQFLVITKGATRVSEVAARFSLDGMPGRQMAIDADLNAGVIDHGEARQRREELAREADFYGAMDGASKFLRGDALAGIAIIFVNILGGLALGIFKSGLGIGEALDLYAKLTIGDGLVSQLPALFISLAAGLLITRSAQPTNLSTEFVRQTMLRPAPLLIAAAFLAVLVFARLPAIPLITIGGGCVGLALVLIRQGPQQPLANQESQRQTEREPAAAGERIEDYLAVDALELEVGLALLRLVDPRRGGDVLERVSQLRVRIAKELGIVVPKVRIRDNLRLSENAYRIRLFDLPVAVGECYPRRVLAVAEGEAVTIWEGIPAVEPLTGREAVWIDREAMGRAQNARLMEPVDVLVSHLKEVIRSHADELLTRDATKQLVERVRESSPAVVDELIPEVLKLGDLQQVLKRLLRDGTSIRNLSLILETLGDGARFSQDLDELAGVVRRRLLSLAKGVGVGDRVIG